MVQLLMAVTSEVQGANHLFIEIGKWHVAVWVQHKETSKVNNFRLFKYEQHEDQNFAEIFEQVKHQSKLFDGHYSSTNIIWETTESLVVPGEFAFNEMADSYLNTMFGSAPGHIVYNQAIKEKAITYRIPAQWQQVAKQLSPTTSTHKYQHLLGNKNDGIRIAVYHKYFIAIVHKSNELQLLRSINFKNAEDILYWIKFIQKTYAMGDRCPVCISGSIDADSKMFKTLQMYVEQLELEKGSKEHFDKKLFEEYPSYYFSHFITKAL